MIITHTYCVSTLFQLLGYVLKKQEKFLPSWGKKDNQYNIETVYVVFQSDLCDGENKQSKVRGMFKQSDQGNFTQKVILKGVEDTVIWSEMFDKERRATVKALRWDHVLWL